MIFLKIKKISQREVKKATRKFERFKKLNFI